MNERLKQVLFLRRGGQVRRFHAEPFWVGDRTTDGQHSFNVALLCHLIIKDAAIGVWAAYRILLGALVHDLGEQAIGDVPAPTKRRLPNLGELDAQEKYVRGKLGIDVDLTTTEKEVVDIADFLEVGFDSVEQFMVGNTYALSIFDQLESRTSTISKLEQYPVAKELFSELRRIFQQAREQQAGILCAIASLDPRQLLAPVDVPPVPTAIPPVTRGTASSD